MAIARNITFDQGANNFISIPVADANGVAIDLTTYTFDAYFKRHTESVNSVTFTTVGYANGLLVMSLDWLTSANTEEGVYTYIIKITEASSNTTTRIQEGLLTLKGE